MFDDVLSKAKELLDTNFELELCEIVDSNGATPRTTGAFMFVTIDGKSFGTIGGGTIEYEVTLYATELLKKKCGDIKEYNLSMKGNNNIGMVCGGNNTIKFTYLTNDSKSYVILDNLANKFISKNIVYIFGGGHVSMEVAKISKYVGFDYVVWDDRCDFANKERFESAKQIICKPFTNINKEINITNNDLIVIMTRGHINDYEVLSQILKSKAFYIGCIGSMEKNEVIRNKLLSDGFTEKEINKICAPIGLNISADTPEEIAISIVSELILFRAKMEGRRKILNGTSLIELPKYKDC